MFNNLINFDDVRRFGEKVQERSMGKWLGSRRRRVEMAWEHTEAPPRHWHTIPHIRKRWNVLVSGKEDIDFRMYLASKYLQEGGKSALSIGCGTGGKEMQWAQTGIFSHLDAFDLSQNRIDEANQEAQEQQLGHICHYFVADAQTFQPQKHYDALIAEGSLHHIAHLESMIPRLKSWLKPDGYFILNDFVGASRFQWTSAQLAHANRLLNELPPAYRTYFGSNRLKTHCYKPGRLSIWLNDPSEAVESSEILPILQEHFSLIELKGLGGSVLHLLFEGIAHHFVQPDATAQAFLEYACSEEDRLLASGALTSDFVVAIWRATP